MLLSRLSYRLFPAVNSTLFILAVLLTIRPVSSQGGIDKGFGEHGWKLSQKHIFNGREEVYIFPSLLKVKFVDLGYTLISDNKVGTVSVYSDSKKIRCLLPIDKFHSSISSTLSIASECPAGLSWRPCTVRSPGEPAKIAGKWYSAVELKNMFKGSPHGGFLAGGRRVEHCTHMLFVTDSIKVAPRLNKIFCEMQGEPDLQALPLNQFCNYLETHDRKSWLKTEVLEPVKLDLLSMKVPDYPLASQLDVTTPSQSNIFEDLLP